MDPEREIPMRGFWHAAWTQVAADWRSWLSALGVFALAALFAVTKAAEKLLGLRRWHDFGNRELAILLIQAVVVAGVVWFVRRRVQRQLDAAERRRWQVEALMAENEVVLRVVRTVVRELAQPLSGALSYSELLMDGADQRDADNAQQVRGLREGILQLNNILQTLRSAVASLPPDGAPRHVADDVERSVTMQRPRPRLRAEDSTSDGIGPDN
jgi:signal transduction histidine kinase